MGVIEDHYYRDNPPYGEADVLARKIIREGKFVSRDLYKYKGNHYWVVNGRVLTRSEGEKLERERAREGRNPLKDCGSVTTR